MQTLELEEAAKFLHMSPATLRRRAFAGEVPAKKTGRRWVFLDVHLVEWLRGDYANQGQELRVVDKKQGKTKKCQSTNAIKHGGYSSPHQMDDEYNKLLGL